MDVTFSNGYALLIGVGDDRPVTARDAKGLYEVLVDPARAAYPPKQVEPLIETNATRDNILTNFDLLIERVKKNPEATVIVYYSGHGAEIEGSKDEYLLLPYNYEPKKWAITGITGLEFTDKIEAIKARKLVVILDCCFAGGIPEVKAYGVSSLKAAPPPQNLIDKLDKGSGLVVITSSSQDEYSYSYSNEKYSVFTSCLLDALAGKGEKEKDGYAHILEVLIYLSRYIPQRTGNKQHPFIKKMLDVSDNFALCYYAGGLKRVDLPSELKDLMQERATYANIIKQKTRLRNELLQKVAVEINPVHKDQWMYELKQVEADLKRYQTKLRKIKQKIDDLDNK